jgi:hypothetical protein
MSLPGFEQSMFMAAQPGHNYIATAPHYCHHYNQLHQRKLIALPIPIDEAQAEKLTVPFTLIWHKRNSHNPKILWQGDHQGAVRCQRSNFCLRKCKVRS